MVVMSMAKYSQLGLRLDLTSKLAEAQASRAAGDQGRNLADIMSDLKD
jgi:hypothetical protein